MSTLLAEQTTNSGGLNYYTNTSRSCQTFTMPYGYDTLEYFNLYLKNGGSYSGTYYVYLYATSGGVPTGSALASATMAGGSIATSYNWYTFDIANTTVTPGAKYAIVAYANGSSSTSNGVAWGHDNSSGFAGGDSFWSNSSGSSWTSLSGDWTFQAYGTVGVVVPTVTSAAASSITATGATLGGNVTNAGGGTVSANGVTYSSTYSPPRKNIEPTVTIGSGTGAFSQAITGLTPNTTYYVRAWGTNQAGDGYGAEISFTTASTTPTVTSGSSSNIASTTATATGTVVSDGGATVTERGIVYDTSTAPTTSDSKITAGTGTGAFTGNITGLTAATLYYWRAYAINANGTVYGTEYTFTTKTIITQWATSVTSVSAGTLTKVSLPLKEILGASSTATVKVYSNASTAPDALLATATKTVTGSNYVWYDFTFNQALSATTAYWIVLDTPYSIGTRHQYWAYDTGGTYGDTKYSVDNTAHWSAAITGCAAFLVTIQPSLTVSYDITVDYKKRYL